MDIPALAVSALALLVAVGSAVYTRQQARSTRGLHDIERRREHESLQPTFEATLGIENGDRNRLRPHLRLHFTGPVDLGHLDRVTVRIRDDQKRGRSTSAGGPTDEAAADYVWGPYRFIPGVDRADRLGRTAGPVPLAVDEVHLMRLQRTLAPPWYSGGQALWETHYATSSEVRLTVVCVRDGYEPWEIPVTAPPPRREARLIV